MIDLLSYITLNDATIFPKIAKHEIPYLGGGGLSCFSNTLRNAALRMSVLRPNT